MLVTTQTKELTEADFRSLTTAEEPPCLSLFVEASPEPEHNKRTLKALLKEAHDLLSRRGLDSTAVKGFLAPLEAPRLEPSLSIAPGQTFLAFLSRDKFRTFVVPLAIKPRLVYGDRFYLKPLLPCLARRRRYHILAISENAVRLFRCEYEQCREVRAEDLPASLKGALGSRDFSSSLQAHSSGVPGHGVLTYHGHSGPVEEVHKNRVMFCRQVSTALEKQLGKSGDPLILACVKEFVPAFKEVNRYAGLVPEAILGNPDRLSPSEIHLAAQNIIDALAQKQTEKSMAEYVEQRGTEYSSSSLPDILRAVFEGRVKTVFVADEADIWGNFDRAANSLFLAADGQGANEQELLNLIASEAVLRGGMAYLLPAAAMPENKPALALFRY